MVMKMELLEIPRYSVLRGEDAIWALSSFIIELEKQKDEELTEKQSKALIKLAKGLRASVEAEMKSEISKRNITENRFATRLKRQLQNTFLNTLVCKTQNG